MRIRSRIRRRRAAGTRSSGDRLRGTRCAPPGGRGSACSRPSTTRPVSRTYARSQRLKASSAFCSTRRIATCSSSLSRCRNSTSCSTTSGARPSRARRSRAPAARPSARDRSRPSAARCPRFVRPAGQQLVSLGSRGQTRSRRHVPPRGGGGGSSRSRSPCGTSGRMRRGGDSPDRKAGEHLAALRNLREPTAHGGWAFFR